MKDTQKEAERLDKSLCLALLLKPNSKEKISIIKNDLEWAKEEDECQNSELSDLELKYKNQQARKVLARIGIAFLVIAIGISLL